MFSISIMFRRGVARVFTIVVVMLFVGSSMVATAAPPTGLTCEYMQNPVGIDTLRPRLGWLIKDGYDERGVRQTACRILVASTREKLDSDVGDLWDTKKVDTDRSANYDYRGKPLTSGMRCWWKAMTWDSSGNPSGWSAPAWWSMGLLSRSDWLAHWITVPATMQPNGVEGPLLRKVFALDKPVRRATVFISGLGMYELHVNGKKVGNNELDPGFTAYDRRVLYATYDITASLHQGRNSLGVMLGNGWYNYAVPAAWDFDKAPWRDRPKLLFQLALEFEHGTTQTIVSDTTWRAALGPILDNEIMTGETYDARKEIRGWDGAEFSDSSWATAVEAAPPAGILSAEAYPAVKVFQTVKPVNITEPKPGVFVYDFGQNLAGTEELTVQGMAGETVKMQFGEELHADGTLSQDNIKSLTKQDGFQTDSYTLKGGGAEVWRPRFTYHGFRYAQVTGLPGKPTFANLRALVLHAGFESAGSFECSNPLLNKIQAATQWAYISNFMSIPTDCPTREKNGWMGDAQLAAETGLYNYCGGPNYAKWIRDMMDAQKPSGELPGIVPTGGWGFAWGNGPAWDSAYVLIPWDLFQFNGDRHILEEQYAGIKRYVDYVDAQSPNHIAAFGLGDWAPFKTETPAELTSTGYFYRDTVLLFQMAHLLNRNPDERKYAQLAANIRDAFNKTYYHTATGLYGDGSQTALSCALYQGLAPDTERKRILENLAASIVANGNHLDTGILGAKYVMRALTDGGQQELAYKLATQTSLPSWGYWIEHGATTLLEQWSGQPLGDFSRNHIMFGDISAWCYETIGGIDPDPEYPGFKRCIIRPCVLGDLTWAKASHRSQYGEVSCEWKRTGEQLSIDVTIPANTTATIYLPAKQMSDVMENGKPAASAACVVPLKMEDGCAVFRVQSGRYRFGVGR
jgi:alpha-L-rhamnosidase